MCFQHFIMLDVLDTDKSLYMACHVKPLNWFNLSEVCTADYVSL